MSKRIYLVRHGQTELNRLRIVQGSSVNASLNETGQRQATAFWDQYQDIPFDRVYTSALNRAIESVSAFIEKGIPHEAHAGLNEISWGHRDGTKVTDDDRDYYWRTLARWREGEVDLKIEGGESPLDVQARQQPVVDLLRSRTDEELVLVCMHGRAMRILLSTLLGTPLVEMDQYEHHNMGLYQLDYDGSDFRTVRLNDLTHLEPHPGLIAR